MATSGAEELVNRAFVRVGIVERFRGGEVRRIRQLVDEQLRPALAGILTTRLGAITETAPDKGPWTTARYRRMQTELGAELDVWRSKALSGSTRSLTDFAHAEAAWQDDVLEDVFSTPGLSFALPAPQTLRSLVVSRPFQGRFLREWYGDLTTQTRKAINVELRTGMGLGEGVPKIVRRVIGTGALGEGGVTKTMRRHATSIVRTAATHVSSHAREAVYEQWKEQVGKVLYLATLDYRTTDICASLDQRTFEVSKGPRPPMHMRCRSTTIPVTERFGTPSERPSGRPLPGKPMGGKRPFSMNYERWLKEQGAETQDLVLGPGRAKLWRRGKVPLRRFTDAKYRPRTLRQLEQLERDILGSQRRAVVPGATPRPRPATRKPDHELGGRELGTRLRQDLGAARKAELAALDEYQAAQGAVDRIGAGSRGIGETLAARNAARDAWESARGQVRSRIHGALRLPVDRRTAVSVVADQQPSGAVRRDLTARQLSSIGATTPAGVDQATRRAREAADWVGSVLDRRTVAAGRASVRITADAGQTRAMSYTRSRHLHISPAADARTYVHEMGHAVCGAMDRTAGLDRWRGIRLDRHRAAVAAGERPVHLSEALPGRSGFGAREWTSGEWPNAYWGRVDASDAAGVEGAIRRAATGGEVPSMAMDTLYAQPETLLWGDRDLWDQVVSIIRGVE